MTISAKMQSDRLRLLTKATQALLGICTGMIADKQLNDVEILFLSAWLKENHEVFHHWPGDIIGQRVAEVLHDGIITEEERSDLLETLTAITGVRFVENGSPEPESPTSLLIDDRDPVVFAGKKFCFTGVFFSGKRSACEDATLSCGGIPVERVTKDLDYLVIGDVTNATWAYEAHGRKIEKAAIDRTQTGKPNIISERHWFAAINMQTGNNPNPSI